MGYQIKKVYVGTNLVRVKDVFTQNIVPRMVSNTQDGFTASASALIGGGTNYYTAFNSQGIHSANIGASNWGYSQIQMPKGARITELTATSRADDPNRPQYPSEIYLQGSNDGTNWTNIGSSISNPFNAINQTKTWSYTGETNHYTYIRLNLQAGNTGYWALTGWNITGRVLI